MTQAQSFTLDSLCVTGTDPDGTQFRVSPDCDWFTGSGTRGDTTPRPGRHGDFDAQRYVSGAGVTLAGTAYASSLAAAESSIRRLRALADGSLRTLTVVEASGLSQSMKVRVNAAPQAAFLTDCAFRWQLVLWAPDPRRFRPVQSLSTGLPGGGSGGLVYPIAYPLKYGTPAAAGRVSFTNTGSAPTEPVITVAGLLAQGFEVAYLETGQRLRYTGLVGGASQVVLDSGAGTVQLDGQDRDALLTVRQWFQVPPSATATFAFSTLGTEDPTSTPAPQMTVAVSPADW